MGTRTRLNYEKQLNDLHEEIIEMSEMVTKSILDSIQALRNKDVKLAQQIIDGDKAVNDKEDKIERLSLNLLLTQQPVASDFRFVTSTLRIITDLERIGDQAADISYLNLKLSNRTYEEKDLGSIIEMANKVAKMVENVVRAYVDGDVDLAHKVIESDDEIDDYFIKVRQEVVEDVKEDRFTTKNSLDMLMIAKYLERIGDHCENVAERIYYSITGENDINK